MKPFRKFSLFTLVLILAASTARSDNPPADPDKAKKLSEELKSKLDDAEKAKKIAEIEKQIEELKKKLDAEKAKKSETKPVATPPGGLPADTSSQFNWRCIGPSNMGGRITALAVYDKDPSTYYVATASGGLLKTVNNGTTFDHQFDNQATVSIGDVAVCQTNPNLVWVGTGEANPRNSVSYGDGVYKSTDGGKTFTNMGLKESFQIGKILIHPTNPDTVYVGVLGRLYGNSKERGLFKTTDAGKTWKKVLFVDDKTGVIDARLDPNNPDTLIVAMWERKRDEFDGFFGEAPVPDAYGPIVTHGPGGGLYKTTDGGGTWKKLDKGLPTAKLGRIGLDYSAKTKGLLYAVIDTEKVGTGDAPKNPYLGIIGENAEKDGGAKLTEITEKSPAAVALLKAGDIVTKANDTVIKTYEDLTDFISTQKPDNKVKLLVKRDDKEITLEVTVGNRPQQGNFPPRGSRGGTNPAINRGIAGFVLAAEKDGAKISSVSANSGAEKAGLKTGDIITMVDGKKVATPEEYVTAAGTDKKPGDKLKLSIKRGDKSLDIEVTLGSSESGPSRGATNTKPYQLGLGGQQANAQDQQGKDGNNTGGVYESKDNGNTWTRVNSLNTRPMYFSVIRVDPTDDKVIYLLADVPVLWKSIDGGKTFKQVKTSAGVHADAHALWIDPKNGNHLIIGCDGGFYVSYDAGLKWEHLNHLALGQFYHVAADNRRPYRVYGGLQDNGSWGGPSNTLRSYGAVNEDWIFVSGGDGFVCRVDPNDPDLVYAESQGGAINRRNFRTGERGFIRPALKQNETPHRFNWNTPFILSSHNSSIFYSAGEFVWKSIKKGSDLKKISPEITRTKAGSATALSESPVNADVLWAGTDDGFVWITKDGGTTWVNVTDAIKAAGLPDYRWVATLEASREREGRCYVCLDAHRSNDDAPYLFVTEDFGKTWKNITGNLPKLGSTRCLREDLVNRDLLYCGTEFGAWVSANRGESWVKLGGNLPTVAVHEIAQTTAAPEIVAATHGRSLWVLDVATLRQMKPAMFKDAVTLFAPPTAVRWRTGVGGESPYSSTDRKFVGTNPARGVSIDYLLTKPAKEISFKVVDVNGKTVRAFTLPKKTAGFHRVSWDLARGAAAAGPQGRGGQGGGGLVGPGVYRVLLTVDGTEYTQPLTIELDPNAPKDLIVIDELEWDAEPANPLKPKKVIPWKDE
ncbi:hypothetical protein BH11PLA2_BH11PLA2_22180 [soil metagenome]